VNCGVSWKRTRGLAEFAFRFRRASQLPKRIAEPALHFGCVRLNPQCLSEFDGRLVEPAGPHKFLSEVCVSLRTRHTSDWSRGMNVLACAREIALKEARVNIVRLNSQRLLYLSESFLAPAEVCESHTEIVMSYRKLGHHGQSGSVRYFRLLRSAELLKIRPHIQVGLAVSRRHAHGGLVFLQGVVVEAQLHEGRAKVRVHLGLIGVDCQRRPIMRDGRRLPL